MNGKLRALLTIPIGYGKLSFIKLLHLKKVHFGFLPRVSVGTEISLDKGASLFIGNKYNMRSSAIIKVRNDSKLIIGNRSSLNINNLIACHKEIVIGDDFQTGPNVQIYDHDHDFRIGGG